MGSEVVEEGHRPSWMPNGQVTQKAGERLVAQLTDGVTATSDGTNGDPADDLIRLVVDAARGDGVDAGDLSEMVTVRFDAAAVIEARSHQIAATAAALGVNAKDLAALVEFLDQQREKVATQDPRIDLALKRLETELAIATASQEHLVEVAGVRLEIERLRLLIEERDAAEANTQHVATTNARRRDFGHEQLARSLRQDVTAAALAARQEAAQTDALAAAMNEQGAALLRLEKAKTQLAAAEAAAWWESLNRKGVKIFGAETEWAEKSLAVVAAAALLVVGLGGGGLAVYGLVKGIEFAERQMATSVQSPVKSLGEPGSHTIVLSADAAPAVEPPEIRPQDLPSGLGLQPSGNTVSLTVALA